MVNCVNPDWAPVMSGVPRVTFINISADMESEIKFFADYCVCYVKSMIKRIQ